MPANGDDAASSASWASRPSGQRARPRRRGALPDGAPVVAEAPAARRRRMRRVRGRGSSDRERRRRRGRAVADSTITRSARKTASGMPCVTSTMVVPVALPEPQQLHVEPLAGQRVEGAERLVQQQHRRVAREGTRDRGALAHAARQLVRPRPLEAVEADQAEQRPGRGPRRRQQRRLPAPAGRRRCRRTSRHGSSRGSWNTSPTRGRRPSTGASVDRDRARVGLAATRRSGAAACSCRTRSAPTTAVIDAAGHVERDVVERDDAPAVDLERPGETGDLDAVQRLLLTHACTPAHRVGRWERNSEDGTTPREPARAGSVHAATRAPCLLPSGLYRRLPARESTVARFAPGAGSWAGRSQRAPRPTDHRSGISPNPETKASLRDVAAS